MKNNNDGMTPEVFDNQYMPVLDKVITLVGTHPDIPDGLDAAELIMGMHTIRDTLSTSIHDDVQELQEAREKAAKDAAYIKKLQGLNQQLNLQVAQQNQELKREKTARDPNQPQASWNDLNHWASEIL